MLNFSLFLFKQELEQSLNIIEWSPTEDDLNEIYNKLIIITDDVNVYEIEKIILGVYRKPIKIFLTNGLDTSTAAMLLAKIHSLPVPETGKDKSE